MMEKYDDFAVKDVYKIVTVDESWIYVYEPETKPQSTVWVFEDQINPRDRGILGHFFHQHIFDIA